MGHGGGGQGLKDQKPQTHWDLDPSPEATVTSYHKMGGIKQQKSILSQS